MDRKKTIAILLIVVAFLIIAAIIYFLFFYRFSEDLKIFNNNKDQGATAELPESKKQITKKIPENKEKNIEPAKEEDINRDNLAKTASSFAERFGSYSNQSDYENITDLRVLMSRKMSDWADEFIKSAREKSDSADIYEGMTTKAISSEIKEINEGQGMAEILVKTQQIKSSGTMDNFSTEYKDILITFIKEDGLWKVNGAKWE